MSTHAKLSPSGAERWMMCPGSVALEDGIVDEGSTYAQEGTAAHFLAAHCLESGSKPHDHRAKTILLVKDKNTGARFEIFEDGAACPGHWEVYNDFEVDEEMVENVAIYVSAILETAQDSVILVEQRLAIAHLTNEPEAKGTTDAVILHPDELHINDLKYGKGVRVEAERNKQMMIYGLAALREFEMLGDFKRVRFTIHQPRLRHVSEWDCSVDELQAFGETVQFRAALTYKAIEYHGNTDPKVWAEMYLNPGDDQCRFCKAKADCPKLRDHVLQTVVGEFDDLTQPLAPAVEEAIKQEHSNPILANLLGSIELIEGWCKAIRAKAFDELRAGREVPGYKLVQGKKGARAWSSETEAEAMLKSMRLKQDQMYSMKVISPTKAEDLLKAEKPKCWKRLQPLITQSEGGLSVAPERDKRPAVKVEVESFEPVAQLDVELAGLV